MSDEPSATSSGSLAFDGAAEYYDETRAIDEHALGETIDVLEEELGGRGRVLEIGVGTGSSPCPSRHAGSHSRGSTCRRR